MQQNFYRDAAIFCTGMKKMPCRVLGKLRFRQQYF
jgi:hypothetical protein